jgi:hypothetical protein
LTIRKIVAKSEKYLFQKFYYKYLVFFICLLKLNQIHGKTELNVKKVLFKPEETNSNLIQNWKFELMMASLIYIDIYLIILF